jgi:hypothetical protein
VARAVKAPAVSVASAALLASLAGCGGGGTTPASHGDASTGDTSTGDGATGDASTGDASTGDAGPVDASAWDGDAGGGPWDGGCVEGGLDDAGGTCSIADFPCATGQVCLMTTPQPGCGALSDVPDGETVQCCGNIFCAVKCSCISAAQSHCSCP